MAVASNERGAEKCIDIDNTQADCDPELQGESSYGRGAMCLEIVVIRLGYVAHRSSWRNVTGNHRRVS
jgi:hypothetical protein